MGWLVVSSAVNAEEIFPVASTLPSLLCQSLRMFFFCRIQQRCIMNESMIYTYIYIYL